MPPRGHVAMFGNIFGHRDPGERFATGIKWAEVKALLDILQYTGFVTHQRHALHILMMYITHVLFHILYKQHHRSNLKLALSTNTTAQFKRANKVSIQ